MKRLLKQALILVIAGFCYLLFPFVWLFMKLFFWAWDLDD